MDRKILIAREGNHFGDAPLAARLANDCRELKLSSLFLAREFLLHFRNRRALRDLHKAQKRACIPRGITLGRTLNDLGRRTPSIDGSRSLGRVGTHQELDYLRS